MDLDKSVVAVCHTVEQVAKGARQLLHMTLQRIADTLDWDTLRSQISTWLKRDTSPGRGSSKPFIDKIKRIYILRTRFPEPGEFCASNWRQVLTSAAQEIQLEYGPEVLETVRKTWLSKKRNPDADFVKPQAYKWLAYLDNNKKKESNPPKYQSWFPKYAIEIAHIAFRLKMTPESFRKYLCVGHRRKHLPTILPQVDVAGLTPSHMLFKAKYSFRFSGLMCVCPASCSVVSTYSVLSLPLCTRSMCGHMVADRRSHQSRNPGMRYREYCVWCTLFQDEQNKMICMCSSPNIHANRLKGRPPLLITAFPSAKPQNKQGKLHRV